MDLRKLLKIKPPESEEQAGKDVETQELEAEKCGPEEALYVPYNVLSFQDAERVAEAQKIANNARKDYSIFSQVSYNIAFSSELSSGEKATKMRSLVAEYADRIGSLENTSGDDEKDYVGTARGSFRVIKGIDGKLRWISIYSNHFEDRQKEILASDAHLRFAERATRSGQFPVLVPWHVKDLVIGQADWVEFTDGFAIAGGYFTNETVAEQLKTMDNLGCSHGFVFQGKDFRNGVYHDYETREISVLPLKNAANDLTAFTLSEVNSGDPQEGTEMGFSKEKRDFLTSLYPEEEITRLEGAMMALGKKAEEKGVVFKDLWDAFTVTEKTEKSETQKQDEPEKQDPVTGGLDAATLKAALTEALTPLQQAITGLDTRMKAVEKSDDEKIADAMTPRNQPGAGFVASKQGVIEKDDEKLPASVTKAIADAQKAGVAPDNMLDDVPEWQKDDIHSLYRVLGVPAAVMPSGS